MLKPLLAAGVVAGAAAPALALTFLVRAVERFGNIDIVIGGPGARLDVSNFAAHRFRFQFGVFDDAAGAAPAGGFVGWNIGSIMVSGTPNSVQTRTPGRLSPFNFATQPGANGNPPLPGGDPFFNLTDIDATVGTQSPLWICDPAGDPTPPSPTIRGRNTFVSVFEITIDPNVPCSNYALTLSGNLIAATEWRAVGTPTPPDCGDPSNPGDDVPGSIVYAPFPLAPSPFEAAFTVYFGPAPTTIPVFLIAAPALLRRRRPRLSR